MSNPGFGTRLRALLKGERSDDDLRRYMNVAGVLDLLDKTQAERAELIVKGTSPWDLPLAKQAQLQEAFAATTLYWLLCDFVQADEQDDPGTAGFVPEVTYEQAMRFAAEFGGHMATANEAAANPDYKPARTGLVQLPGWVEVEPCPAAHLHAMVMTAGKMQERIDALLADVQKARITDPIIQGQLNRVLGIIERARTETGMAQSLYGTGGKVSEGEHERIETHVKEGIRLAFDAGQLLSAPALIASYGLPQPGYSVRLAGPSEPGFDPLCLTWPKLATAIRNGNAWQYDVDAGRGLESIKMTWDKDPDPRLTLGIQEQISAMMQGPRPLVVLSNQGFWSCCPWAPVYRANGAVSIAGTQLRAGDTFTYDVSAEEMDEGGQFVRRIVKGPFRTADETDYCDGEDED